MVGEEGVAPGQACVFYDAPAGQARVLGGGIIKSVTSAAEPIDARPSRAQCGGRGPRLSHSGGAGGGDG